jgi:hypothetical protein
MESNEGMLRYCAVRLCCLQYDIRRPSVVPLWDGMRRSFGEGREEAGLANARLPFILLDSRLMGLVALPRHGTVARTCSTYLYSLLVRVQ